MCRAIAFVLRYRKLYPGGYFLTIIRVCFFLFRSSPPIVFSLLPSVQLFFAALPKPTKMSPPNRSPLLAATAAASASASATAISVVTFVFFWRCLSFGPLLVHSRHKHASLVANAAAGAGCDVSSLSTCGTRVSSKVLDNNTRIDEAYRYPVHPRLSWCLNHTHHYQRVEPQAFTAEGVGKEELLVPQTYFGWSSEDVDMQARRER